MRSAWIDNSALKGTEYIGAKKLKDMLKEAGIPVREFRSGREMHSGRARKPAVPPAGMKKHPRDMTPAEWAEWGEEQRRKAQAAQK